MLMGFLRRKLAEPTLYRMTFSKELATLHSSVQRFKTQMLIFN